MTRVVAQMLVGRNREPFLPYALRSIAWVDLFAVCSTAPGDPVNEENLRTVRAEVSEEKLRLAEVVPDKRGRFSFAEARNRCLALSEPDDFVLIVDADDVHYPECEEVVRAAVCDGVDSLTAHFYHLMVYRNLFQFVAPREMGFRSESSRFEGVVHESLETPRRRPRVVAYRYVHYGYVKPQAEVFERWRFYAQLEGDARRYDGQPAERILEDRIPLSQELDVAHPPVVAAFIASDQFTDSPALATEGEEA